MGPIFSYLFRANYYYDFFIGNSKQEKHNSLFNFIFKIIHAHASRSTSQQMLCKNQILRVLSDSSPIFWAKHP
jgi:hypothetical protein